MSMRIIPFHPPTSTRKAPQTASFRCCGTESTCSSTIVRGVFLKLILFKTCTKEKYFRDTNVCHIGAQRKHCWKLSAPN